MQKVMGVLAERFGMGPDSVFVDIGSGFGRPVFAAALYGRVGVAWGIELVASRVEVARRAWETVRAAAAPCGTRVEFRHGDATQLANWPRSAAGAPSATHIFGFDRDFDADVTRGIAAVVNASRSVRVIVSFMKLAEWEACGLRGFAQAELIRGLAMAGSGSGCTAYVFERERAPAKGRGKAGEAAAAASSGGSSSGGV
jgi:SAM-dependent methyltransferase